MDINELSVPHGFPRLVLKTKALTARQATYVVTGSWRLTKPMELRQGTRFVILMRGPAWVGQPAVYCVPGGSHLFI